MRAKRASDWPMDLKPVSLAHLNGAAQPPADPLPANTGVPTQSDLSEIRDALVELVAVVEELVTATIEVKHTLDELGERGTPVEPPPRRKADGHHPGVNGSPKPETSLTQSLERVSRRIRTAGLPPTEE